MEDVVSYGPPEHYTVLSLSGRALDLLAPSPEMVDLDDIAFSLAHQNRYNGHFGRWSVAAHAIVVALTAQGSYANPVMQLHCLHHDDPEVWLADLPRDVKRLLHSKNPLLGLSYGALEESIEEVVCQHFSLPALNDWERRELKRLDDVVHLAEVSLLCPEHIGHYVAKPKTDPRLRSIDFELARTEVYYRCQQVCHLDEAGNVTRSRDPHRPDELQIAREFVKLHRQWTEARVE